MSESANTGFIEGLFQGIGVLVVAVVAWTYFTAPSSKGLNVGNLHARYKDVKFDISNTSANSGNVLIWIEKDGIQKCEHIFPIKPNNKISNIYFPCKIGQGRFSLKYVWADSEKGKASIAKKIALNF